MCAWLVCGYWLHGAATEDETMSNAYEIISETRDGRLVSACTVKANSSKEAHEKCANFCDMMGIAVHSVISSSRYAVLVESEAAPDYSAT